MRRLACLALLLAGCAGAPPAPAPVRVVILHTNDIHGAAHPQRAAWLDKDAKPLVGGLAAVARHIKRVRAEEKAKGAAVLVVDCGDFFQGTPEGDLTKGRLVIEAMNAIGYDALCLGNHDFDLGPKTTQELAALAQFPFLCANVRLKGTRDPPSWLVAAVDFPDLRLEFLGLITSDMPNVTVEKAREGLEFDGEEEALKRHGWDRPAEGRARVLLTHVGYEREAELAKAFPIDALLGGHSHSRRFEKIGAVAYLQSGDRAAHVGRLDLLIDGATGRVIESSVKLEVVRVSDGEDAAVKRIIEKYAPEIDRVMNEVVGELAVDLPKDAPGRSSPLGSYLCDLMREATGAEVALHNRTGIRASMAKGKVRLRDVYQVSPFKNTLVTLRMRGSDLRGMLERSIAEPRLLLEASGLELVYEKGAIVELAVGGAPLDPAKEYVVVTNSFLAKGGDGHAGFTRGREVKDTLLDLMDVHVQDLRRNSPRSYEAKPRVRPKE
jgi:2',3'-cyclic-nucleotide 2'-phosphodiesterase (5'-nucleotidase family)